ncbi:MAG: hypothetical protein C0412_03030 [Flavobacterium sp.]|nr:hypothetical protein [Flavobacterium sp.]
MGFWFFITGGILFLKWKDGKAIIPYLRSKFLFLILLVVSPFLISLANSIFLSVCPFGNGIWFYLFISIISMFLGIILASTVKTIAGKHPYLLFSFSVFGFASISVLEIYFYPQIFTFNPLIGLFPGTMYDELIEFDAKLFYFRFYNVLLFTGFLLLVNVIRSKFDSFWIKINKFKLYKGFSSVGIVLLFFTIYWLGNLVFGFTIPLSKIEIDLGGKLITEHFIMIYPKEISKEDVIISALHHEFYYEEISVGLNLSKKEKIVSLLFASSRQKKKYIGSANADMSKPWQNIVITDFYNHDLSLKHEIVHAFSSDFGGILFKMPYNLNPVLLEGIAEAIENKFGDQDLYSAAFMIRKFNKKISLEKLFSGLNFFGQSSSISYAYSGAFIKYLIEKYGVENLKKLYTDIDFMTYYGKSLAELEIEFSKFIDDQSYAYNPNRATLYFSGKPIFLKKCPRYVAYRMKKGNELYNKNDYRNSLEVYRDVYFNAESNSALTGIVNSLIKLNKNKEALDFLHKEIKKFENTTSISFLKILMADLYLRNDEFNSAADIYKKIILDYPHQEYVINALIRLSLGEAGKNILKRFVEGESKERKEIILSSNTLSILYKTFWLYGSIGENNKEIIDLMNRADNYLIQNDIDLYVVYKISQYFKDKGDFTAAKKFAKKAINYNLTDKGIRTLLEENLKKINFFINFKDKLKKKFIFN